MKTALRVVLVGLLLALAAGALVLAAALQGEPAVTLHDEVRVDDIARAVALLRQHDPRRLPPGMTGAALLGERDLDILLGQGLRRWVGGAGRVSLRRGGATVQLSARVPPNPFGRWLNLELDLVETGGRPAIDGLRVGRLPLPGWLAERAGPWLVERAGLRDEALLAAAVVQRVRFRPQQMQVNYVWNGDSKARVVAGLVPPADQQRLRAYSDRLVDLAPRERVGWTVPLARLMGPLFELARERSAAGGDAAAENRAAILVLTLFVNGRGVGDLLPAARAWPRPPPLRVLLAGRDDSPQHYLVSAALAAEASGPLSKVVGVYKEVADSRGGSGFSFIDLAADRAGTRFGELAVRSPELLQARADALARESEFMPHVADLPEDMQEAEFRRRFGGVGAPSYDTLLVEIDRRIATLALFR
jgi:hypothetical protein